MPPITVFISYSSKDKKLVEELESHLKPYEGGPAPVLKVWRDAGRLRASDTIDAVIENGIEEARIAVCALSTPFLNSKYIREIELPAIVAAVKAGTKRLCPLFVGPSAFDDPDFTVPLRDGSSWTPHGLKGLNRPTQPLQGLGKKSRDQLLNDAALAIFKLAKEIAEAEPQQLEPMAASRGSFEPTELTIRLTAIDGKLVRSFTRGGSTIHADVRSPWSLYERKLAEPSSRGELLFDVLFGNKDLGGEILKRLAGSDYPVLPMALPLHVRLETSEPRLLGVNWFRTAFEGNRLVHHGWSITHLPPGEQRDGGERVVELSIPSRIALWICDPADGPRLDASDHLLRMKARLSPRWRHKAYPISSTDRIEELAPHLADAPSTFYCFARAELRGGKLSIAGCDAGGRTHWTRLDELVTYFKGSRAKLAFFNLVGIDLAAAAPALTAASGIAELVVLQCCPGLTLDGSKLDDDPRDIAERWLDGELRGAAHPDPLGTLAWSSPLPITAWSRFDRWQTTEIAPKVPPELARFMVDRHNQRGRTLSEARALIESNSQRVALLFGCGDLQNHPERLAAQLAEELGHFPMPRPKFVRLPEVRCTPGPDQPRLDRRRIGEQVLREMHADSERDFFKELQSLPRDKTRLLFIDFGVFGTSESQAYLAQDPRANLDASRIQPPLGIEEMRELVNYLGESVAPNCPEEWRVIALATCEAPAADQARIEQLVQDVIVDANFERVRVLMLPLLGKIDGAGDLRQFLMSDASECPTEDAKQAALDIYQVTQGRFGEVVGWIARGDELNWSKVYFAELGVRVGRPRTITQSGGAE